LSEKKIKITVKPIGKKIFLESPTNGLKAILGSGIGIKTECGGMGVCGKCRIIILDSKDIPVSEREKKVLSSDEIKKGVRLACQQIFNRDLTIYIPPSSLIDEQKLQVEGEEFYIKADPVCRKYYLDLKKATLEDMKADFDRVSEYVKNKYTKDVRDIDFKALNQMPLAIRENSWKVTATLRENQPGSEIVLIEGGDKTKNSYGIAIDLGTTKIAIFLVGLITGNTVDSMGIMNPQIKFGEDIMSRLSFATQNDSSLKEIHDSVIESINEAIEKLCNRNGISQNEVIDMSVVANTAMHHLFLGLPVRQLAISPFLSLTGKAINLKAREIGIDISPGAYIYMLPPIAGFVGSDHLAMILATRLYEQEGNCIGIDIGTNTEIALKTDKGIVSVSTASGPAFEGAHIKYGMRAAPGAIERVTIDPKTHIPDIKTIGDRKPIGICGSGILDSVAELLKAGIIDKKGKFIADNNCLVKDSDGNSEYILWPQLPGPEVKDRYEDRHVSINQKDIVEIQLAKGAIRTGIEIILEHSGISFDEIDKIIIAGAFGSYIYPKSVINIGMFPKVSLDRIFQVGNAAGVGSRMVLISKEERKIAEDIASKIKYLEITLHPNFSDYFAVSTFLPGTSELI